MADLDYLINFAANTGGVDAAHSAINKLQAAMAALGLGIGLKELAETADAYDMLAGRIRVAVGETGDFDAAMQGVQRVALETNSSLDATSLLYTKINDVGKQMGMTQEDVLGLTKTITQAMQIGGSSAASSEAALVQLTQALQSGVLRGDEFNSIMEQAPGISQALARSLGVTTGELRKMAGEGQLSSQLVIEALQKQSAAINEEFNKYPLTIGQALNNIKTQWQIVVGEFNSETGATRVVVQALQVIGDNLGVLKTVFDDVGDGVNWFTQRLQQIDASTVDELRRVLDVTYEAVKDVTGALGDMAETTVSAFNSVMQPIADFFGVFGDGQEQISGVDFALRAVQLAVAMVSDGVKGASIALNLFLAVVQGMAAAVTTAFAQILELTPFDKLAKQARQAADGLTQSTRDTLARTHKQAMEFDSQMNKLADDWEKTEEQRNAESVANTQKALAQKTQAANDYTKSQQDHTRHLAYLDVQLQEARKKGDDATVKTLLANIQKIEQEQQASAINQKKAEREKQEAVLEYAKASIQAHGGVISKQLEAELAAQGYKAAISDAGKISVESMRQAQGAADKTSLSLADMALNAAKGLGVDVPAAMNEMGVAFTRGLESVRQVADGFGELSAAGRDASGLIAASLDELLKGAKSQKEIEAVRQMYIEFGRDGKLSAQQVADGIDEINKKLNKTPDLLDENARAFKELGIISKQQALEAAQTQMRAFETVKNSGLASTDQIKKALIDMSGKIAESGDVNIQQWYKQQLAANGLSASIDKAGKLAVEANAKAQPSYEETQRKLVFGAQAADDFGKKASAAAGSSKRSFDSMNNTLDNTISKLESIETRNRAIKEQNAKESAARDANNKAVAAKSAQDVANYSTATAIEGFLKSAGVSAERAVEETRKLMSQYGRDGRMNWAAANGVTEGRPMSAAEFAKYKSPSVYLLDVAEKAKAQEQQQKEYEAHKKRLEEWNAKEQERMAQFEKTEQNISNLKTAALTNQPSKTINVNLNFDGQSMPMQINSDDEELFNKFIQRLQTDAKRQAR